jgi:hypothetical protein
MKMIMTEHDNIALGIIFSRTKNREKFTDDSLLYQKILTFSLGVDHRSFIRWEICTWLKNNHQPFESRSVESLLQLVGRKIDKLIKLHLIHKIGTRPISTATGQTPVYSFDPMSYFLGWLIESLISDPTKRSGTINKGFSILYLMLETNARSSMNIFLKSLIWKIKENGLFSHLINYMIELLESDNSIKDISDLINQILLFRHTDLNLVNKYNELWVQTLNELDPKMRQLVMFRIKLLYEQRMKDRAYDPAEFEKIRFSARERFDKIVLECACLSCQHISYEMIDPMEYMIRLRYHIKGIPTLEKDCPSCNKIDSLQIIDL